MGSYPSIVMAVQSRLSSIFHWVGLSEVPLLTKVLQGVMPGMKDFFIRIWSLTSSVKAGSIGVRGFFG